MSSPYTAAKWAAVGGLVFGLASARVPWRGALIPVAALGDALWFGGLCVLIYVALQILRGDFWSANAIVLLTVACGYGWGIVAIHFSTLPALVIGAVLNGASTVLLIATWRSNVRMFRAVRKANPEARKFDWVGSTTGARPIYVFNRPKLRSAVASQGAR